MPENTNYWQNMWNALRGKRIPVASDRAPDDLPQEEAALRGRIASLQMDIEDRDRQIETLRAEYADLRRSGALESAAAGDQKLEALFGRLVQPLANLAILDGLSAQGRQIAVEDLLALFRDLEKELGRYGLERIGTAGDRTEFDTVSHQMMTSTAVAGVAVLVRVPGYRLKERILLKAMVSTAS